MSVISRAGEYGYGFEVCYGTREVLGFDGFPNLSDRSFVKNTPNMVRFSSCLLDS